MGSFAIVYFRKGGSDVSAAVSRGGGGEGPDVLPASYFCAVALVLRRRSLGCARVRHADAPDVPPQPPVPATRQWLTLAGSPGSFSALLAGDDRCDDAAVQHAHGHTGGVRWSQISPSCRDSPGVSGR